MKQVGLNVASDPLMSLNYVGIKAGMVVVVADDPGPISSQTEQDTRRFGQFAKLVVFDPSTPEEACSMVSDAFECSEKIGRPVILRPTTRVCHSYASVELPPELPRLAPEGFSKDDGRWVIFPRLAYKNKSVIEKTLRQFSRELTLYSSLATGERAKKGIAAGGVSWRYMREALGILEERGFGDAARSVRLLKIGTIPFAEHLGFDFLDGLEEALVVEELDPVIEDALIRLCGLYGKSVKIRGKVTGDMPLAGENTVEALIKTISNFLGLNIDGGISDGGAPETVREIAAETPALPVRPPVLCAGCPHRGAFFAVKEAMEAMAGRRAVFSGDIGCYTLGNARPLDMVDTCLCMGAGITMAQGLSRAEPDAVHFAFIGDSTFFHTGVSGLINAVYNCANVIIVILDNGTTAMTGGQSHPGMDRTLMGAQARRVSIYELVKGIGADDIQRVNPFDIASAKAAAARAADMKGVRVIIFEGPCVNIVQKGNALTVSQTFCRGCKLCCISSKLGCPAISAGTDRKAVIDATLCTGCGICRNICCFNAIVPAAEGEATR
jgi:indolepyruvate ferredoxin oxidoreductase alpha subunit